MSLCLASKKPSKWEFFVPAGTDLGVKLLIVMEIRMLKVEQNSLTTDRKCVLEQHKGEQHYKKNTSHSYLDCSSSPHAASVFRWPL